MAEAKPREIEIYADSKGGEPFDTWLSTLRDVKAQAAVLARLEQVRLGNLGDHESVGDGVSELRIHLNPGYRVYYGQQGMKLTLLCGGKKSSQKRDIARAKKHWEEHKKQDK